MAKIKTLKDKGEVFYPQTHIEAVVDDNGNTVTELVDNIEKKIPAKVSQLENDKNYALATNVQANTTTINNEIARATQAEQVLSERIDNIPLATTENDGLMSAEDKKELNSKIGEYSIVDKTNRQFSWVNYVKAGDFVYDKANYDISVLSSTIPEIGKSIQITSLQAGTQSPKFYLPFSYHKSLFLNFWAANKKSGTQGFTIMLSGMMSTQINVSYSQGSAVWNLKFSIPPFGGNIKDVVNAINGGQVYIYSDSQITKQKSYISDYAGNEYESLSIVIDDYKIIDGIYYWHYRIVATNLYETSYLSLSAIQSDSWKDGESLIFANVIISNKNIEGANKRIIQDEFQNPSLALEIDKMQYDYSLDNEMVDVIEGCGVGKQIDQSAFSAWTDKKILFGHSIENLGYAMETAQQSLDNPFAENSVIVKGFSVTSNSTLPFYASSSKHNNFFSFKAENIDNNPQYTAQLWFDTNEWNGNGLIRSIKDSYIIIPPLLEVGMRFNITDSADGYKFREYNVHAEVIAKINNFVCVRFYNIREYGLKLSLLSISGAVVDRITLYQPTMVKGDKIEIDPYSRYLSYSQKHHPRLRGKNILLLGDSQYNNSIVFHELIKAGMNVYDAHYGGHSMGYNEGTSVNSISKSWFYQQNYRDLVMSAENIDIYLLTCSTNDVNNGGELTSATIQQVLDSYPKYNDADASGKMTLFNSLSLQEKKNIFTYVATYAAYIRQIYEFHPYANVYLCTLPISCSGYMTGAAVPNPDNVSEVVGSWKEGYNADSVREAQMQKFIDKVEQVTELSNWFNATLIDLFRESGLTFDNYIYHCTDGTHWHKDISYNCAAAIIKKLS